ncbi:MAG: hypothetical protein ABSG31_07310 [Tepidisphaeraceae bacterium]|jgi:hypothetical protein
MKSYVGLALAALLGMFAVSANAAPVLPGQDVWTMSPHQTFTQDYFDYSLPHTVYSGDVELMNGSQIIEILSFLPESGHANHSKTAEIIPVYSDTAPPLLSDTTQIDWTGYMTDYTAGCNTYCIGTPDPTSVPLPASWSLGGAGVVLVMLFVRRKSRQLAAI